MIGTIVGGSGNPNIVTFTGHRKTPAARFEHVIPVYRWTKTALPPRTGQKGLNELVFLILRTEPIGES